MEPIIDMRPCKWCSQPVGPPNGKRPRSDRRFCANCKVVRSSRNFEGHLGPRDRNRRRAAWSLARLANETETRKQRAQVKAVSHGRDRLVVPIDGLDEELALLVAQQAADDTTLSFARGLPSFLTEEYPE